MRYIKLFEEYNSDDSDIFKKIWQYSNDKWFIDGNDAPDDIIADLEDDIENHESKNDDLMELIELTGGGPGYTDVWLSRNTLISDAMADGYTRDGIDADNQRYFAERRKELIDKLSDQYPIVDWEKIK